MLRRQFLHVAAATGFIGVVKGFVGVRSASADGEGPVVHWPRDLSNLEGDELEHIPILSAHPAEGLENAIDLEIQVGQRLHPMNVFHSIRWVQIWIDETKAMEMTLEPNNIVPRWRVTIAKKAPFRITVKVACNRHGIWANRLAL